MTRFPRTWLRRAAAALRTYRAAAGVLALLAVAALSTRLVSEAAGGRGSGEEAPPVVRAAPSPATLVFLADTQLPMWIETLRLTEDDNREARAAVFSEIAADRRAAAVFLLGDMVARGSSDDDWTGIDAEFAKLRAAGLPLFPAFGNHEYMFDAEAGRANVLTRFPWLRESWYAVRADSVAVVILNSNISSLTERDAGTQRRWYDSALAALDADPAVRVVIVGCHHSPYTNSTIVSPDAEVQRDFVPGYLASKKARLFVSGHAHACEHFRVEGKDFLVTGGGGGILQPLLTGGRRRMPDLFPGESARRRFHYMRCRREGADLVVQIRMLRKNTREWGVPYAFRIDGH